jgi:hypothetical protein
MILPSYLLRKSDEIQFCTYFKNPEKLKTICQHIQNVLFFFLFCFFLTFFTFLLLLYYIFFSYYLQNYETTKMIKD